jgi:hypothetical protein
VDDQAFYAVAAQVIPVLLLALIFENRLLRIQENESLGNSVYFIGVFGALLVGEITALAALSGTDPSRLEKSTVWLALIFGVLLLVGWPIWSRVQRVFDVVPSGVRFLVESAVLIGVVVVAYLVMFDLISENWLSGIAAVLVLACIIGGAFLARFGPGARRA